MGYTKNGKKLIKCPFCGSYKMFRFCLDSDWGGGSGDYWAVNPDEYYTEEELEMDAFNRPDIELYHCRDCWRIFTFNEWNKAALPELYEAAKTARDILEENPKMFASAWNVLNEAIAKVERR